MGNTVLIIDDDKKLTNLLENYLGNFAFRVISRHHPAEGINAVRMENPDIIVLDIMLPDMDGFEVCRSIRKFSDIPIIMLTARGDVTDRVVGLETGADDYLSKPFEPRELTARIGALLRRISGNNPKENISIDSKNLLIKKGSRQAFLKEQLLDLTSLEFDLLVLFSSWPEQVLNRDSIMENLKGCTWSSFDRSVDVLISRLRKKLKQAEPEWDYIKTVWGSGYLFSPKE